MNNERWRKEKDPMKLALKLCEETGEVAKAVLLCETSKYLTKSEKISRQAAVRLELRDVEIIMTRLREVYEYESRGQVPSVQGGLAGTKRGRS